jgi:PIN domain nuclease of toxin-antitoxin system
MAEALELTTLSISQSDAEAVEFLPPHHNDPFDRMLVAQALARDLAIVSADAVLDRYGVTRVW